MKAIVQRRFGPPDVLELREVEKPAIGDGDVLVRVRASSVNPADWHVIRGRPFLVRLAGYGLRTPKKPVPGSDVAGVVEAVGAAVTTFRPGDDVYGFGRGAYAEYAAASADRLVPKPATLTFDQAAAVPLAATTAIQGLRDTGLLRAGQQVLVIGASGGVGTFAIQIAKALGAEVTGVCSTRNVEMVRSIGADRVIDYTRDDLLRGGERYDLILQLAGTASPGRLRRLLAPSGSLVLSSGDGRLSGIDRIVTATATSPFVRQRLTTFVARHSGADLAALTELIEAGKVTPIVDRTYPLEETAAAVAHVETGHARGKVVITI
jgi:NADPH:quinone reductase-like Zn-dependent oxidoreductase